MKIEIKTRNMKATDYGQFAGFNCATFQTGAVCRVGVIPGHTYGPWELIIVNYRGGLGVEFYEPDGELAMIELQAPEDAPLPEDALNGLLTALVTLATVGGLSGLDPDGLRYAATQLGGKVLK